MDMLQDVNTGISWVLSNMHLYGGDPHEVFLVGQSAGGHLTSLAMLAQAILSYSGSSGASNSSATDSSNNNNNSSSRQEDGMVAGARDDATARATVVGGCPSWDLSKIKGYVGVSGAYNLLTLADHLHRRGLYRHLFESIMTGPEGRPMLQGLSPALIAQTNLPPAAAARIPHILLLHGTADKSVPIENARGFAEALHGVGVECRLKEYEGKTHTQPIIEDPMRGGRDELMDEVLTLIRGEPCLNVQFPMLPGILIDAATLVCPF